MHEGLGHALDLKSLLLETYAQAQLKHGKAWPDLQATGPGFPWPDLSFLLLRRGLLQPTELHLHKTCKSLIFFFENFTFFKKL
jgi:hypothetical protein